MDAEPLLLQGRMHDLGDGFIVRRMLPTLQARRVGPFVFYDHMGPADFPAGRGINVRPHPHIGLATVTWLLEGSVRHRDSLGSAVDITPGAVNWMTAGRGITHSERTPPAVLAQPHRVHGIQVWVALPQGDAEMEPEFHHHEANELPRVTGDGVDLVLIAGTGWGARSPVKVFAPMFFAEARLAAGAELPLPAEHAERGVHVIEGDLTWGTTPLAADQFAVRLDGAGTPLRAGSASRVMLFGGAPLDGDRRLWWNFVASTPERIEQAKADWREGRFAMVPGEEDDALPLPPG